MKNKKKMCFGVIIGTRAYFNSELAKDVRKQLLETLTKEGYDYVILPEDATPTGSSSIETREDGLKCAKLFRENRDRIDGIIVSLPNFGFEIGIINAISVADLNVPVLVQACDDENDKVDLDSRRDAFCGKISVCPGVEWLPNHHTSRALSLLKSSVSLNPSLFLPDLARDSDTAMFVPTPIGRITNHRLLIPFS